MAQLSVELTANIRRLEAELAKAKKELNSLEGVADRTGKRTQQAFNKAGKGVANTTPTLLEFNRVVQDAPFGIQGVANNLTQLTQNFGQLRVQAGGTRAALKLLVGGLAGPAGILFAVSAVTSLLVTFGDELFKSGNKAEKLTKKLEAINEVFDSELRLSKAIEESLELQGKSTTSILNSRNSLISNQLTGLANLIKEQQQLLKIQKIENARVDNIELITGALGKAFNVAKAFATVTFNTAFDKLVEDAQNLLNIEIDRSKFSSASAKDKEEERRLQVQLNNLLSQQRELQNDILKINQQQANSVRSNITALSSGISEGLAQTGGNGIFAPLLTSLDQLPQKFQSTTTLILDLTQTLTQGVASGFASLGQTLAQGGNLFGAVGQAILQTVGSIITQLGQATIQAGVAGLALKSLFKNPAAAIAAGGALVALGSALSSARASVGSIGTGNVGGQGSGSFSGSSASFSTSGGFGDGVVTFEIQGQKLVGVLQRTLGRNQRLGGNLSLN